jgi:hypothetical protein
MSLYPGYVVRTWYNGDHLTCVYASTLLNGQQWGVFSRRDTPHPIIILYGGYIQHIWERTDIVQVTNEDIVNGAVILALERGPFIGSKKLTNDVDIEAMECIATRVNGWWEKEVTNRMLRQRLVVKDMLYEIRLRNTHACKQWIWSQDGQHVTEIVRATKQLSVDLIRVLLHMLYGYPYYIAHS